MPSHKCSVTLATKNGEGEGDSLCYDDNYVVVIITQAISIALTIVGGEGNRALVGGHGGGGWRVRCVYLW